MSAGLESGRNSQQKRIKGTLSLIQNSSGGTEFRRNRRFFSSLLELLFKAEAFLKRSILKARDAFDIKLLMDSGAVLSPNLKAHLADGPAADRLEDPKFIADRIGRVDSRTSKPELQPYLPEQIYRELEKEDFESLRRALTELFGEWL